MTLEQIRDVVSKRYPSAAWRRRVMNMREDQVLAIYHRLMLGLEPAKETASEIQLRLF